MSKSENPGTSPPNAKGLYQRVKRAAPKGLPPVHLWNPPFSGDLDMQIKRDGTWFYEGTPIKRPELVRLFASILKLEEGRYYLVTPVEKVGLTVDDAPFVAVDCEAEVDGIHFETNVGDRVVAALIDRKSFYRLVEMGEVEDGNIVVRSGGTSFLIGSAI